MRNNGGNMSNWALILGASTGHGGATAISLAEKGYGIISFHFDRGEDSVLRLLEINVRNKIFFEPPVCTHADCLEE